MKKIGVNKGMAIILRGLERLENKCASEENNSSLALIMLILIQILVFAACLLFLFQRNFAK